MHRGDIIAIDWGTTNRRAYRIDEHGHVLDSLRDDRGVLAVARGDFRGELTTIRDRLGALPVIAAGMIGSTRGWRETPYAPAPVDMAALAAMCVTLPDDGVVIVPGVAIRSGARADVMRGEEVQVLGAIAAGLAPGDATLCQPGTHAKWVETRDARIVDITTAMTGELFALLRRHGTLAGMLEGDVADGRAFRDGLTRGMGAKDLAVALFGVRAAVLLSALDPADAAAFASGVLIGADVGGRDLEGRTVHLVAGGALADLYAAAIDVAGGRAVPVDSEASFVAGIHRIRELIR